MTGFREQVLKWLTRVLACCWGMAWAESPYLIDVWTTDDGLPQSRVLAIAQTPDGYLWVSTEQSWMARFDGIGFSRLEPEKVPELESPSIQMLTVDDRGVLWIGDIDGRLVSYQGGTYTCRVRGRPRTPGARLMGWAGRHGDENLFVSEGGHLLRVKDGQANLDPHAAESAARQDGIARYCQTADGIMWAVTQAGKVGLWLDDRLVALPELVDLEPFVVRNLTPAADSSVLLATTGGLFRWGGNRLERLDLGDPALSADVRQMEFSGDGGLWCRTGDRLLKLRGDQVVVNIAAVATDSTPSYGATRMFGDAQGGVWVIDYGRGIFHATAQGDFIHLTAASGLPSDWIETWFQDREGNIWLGSSAGLVRIRPRLFGVIGAAVVPGLSTVTSICESWPGTIRIGTANGLLDWRDGICTPVPLPVIQQNIAIADVTVAPGSGPGELWIGTVRSGTLHLKDGKFDHPFPVSGAGDAIRVIRRDPQGNLWFGGEFGLFRWDGRVLRKFDEADGLNPGHIFDLAFDDEGGVWITKAYECLVHFKDDRFRTLPTPGISKLLRTFAILADGRGGWWLGTLGGGLLHWKDGRITRITTAEGLPSDSVTQLLLDDAGNLWGGTHHGIFRVPQDALLHEGKPAVIQVYGRRDGLPTGECTGGLQPVCWKAADGVLWFATAQGAVRVDPRDVVVNRTPPQVVIEQMRVNEQDRDGTVGDGGGEWRIQPGRHRFEFQFVGISLSAPEKVTYAWQLRGVDQAWVSGGHQRSVAYSSLPPGHYEFMVKARSADGIWSAAPAITRFEVAAHLWERPVLQWVFLILAMAAASAWIARAMRRSYRRQLEHVEFERSLEMQRFRHKQAMEAERARIASDLHDDLGASLTHIQWLGEAVSRAEPSGGDVKDLLQRIVAKSREMVRSIDEIVWAVNPRYDTLEHLVAYLCNSAEQFFRHSNTRCRIDVGEGVPDLPLPADLRNHLFLIAKEALHNAARHSGSDFVWLRIRWSGGRFEWEIEDHGRGGAAGGPGGDGLANMRRRASQIGADFTLVSPPGGGTLVKLSLPIHPEAP